MSSASVDFGDQFNLDESILGEARGFNGSACRCDDALRCEVLGVNRVHGGEVIHVFEIDIGLDDAIERSPRGFEDSFQVLESAPGLLGDSAGDELLGGGIKSGLSGGEDEIAAANALRIGSDRLGRRRGGDDRFAHEAILAGEIP